MRVLQPRHYASFRCIGADCEDTCCNGWGVTVDKDTYDKYQNCGDPELRASFDKLITINAGNGRADHYASIKLTETHCPFLSDGLCSIQNKLGEEYLSKTCATYPRVMNMVDGVLERSLDLSCPEAARLALLEHGTMEFDQPEGRYGSSRLGNLSILDSSNSKYADKPYGYFHEVRGLVIELLQNRSYPLWQRLTILGYFCDAANEVTEAGEHVEMGKVVSGYADAIQHGLFADVLSKCRAQPVTQLEVVLELIVCRISSDFTARRFLACYEEFMRGIEWTQESTMEEIGFRYQEAYEQYYAPFMIQHQSIMERHLVNYVYKTLFPFGPQESHQKLSIQGMGMRAQYMLLIVYYAIMKTVLVGISRLHKSTFNEAHIIKVIQSCSKVFEHSTSYPARAMEILAGKGMKTAASVGVLVRS